MANARDWVRAYYPQAYAQRVAHVTVIWSAPPWVPGKKHILQTLFGVGAEVEEALWARTLDHLQTQLWQEALGD